MKGLLLVCGGSWLGIKLMKPDLHKTFRSSYSLGRLCWATVTGKPVWRCLSGCVWIKPCGDGLPSWEMEGKQRQPKPVTSRAWCSMSHHEPSWVLDSSSLPMHPFYHTFSLGFRWVTTPISGLQPLGLWEIQVETLSLEMLPLWEVSLQAYVGQCYQKCLFPWTNLSIWAPFGGNLNRLLSEQWNSYIS